MIDELVNKHQKKQQHLQLRFYYDLGKLQNECKHEKTHWMQEIRKDGSFKENLYKRCFVCGATVETLEAPDSFREQLLNKFDSEVESKKSSDNAEKTAH